MGAALLRVRQGGEGDALAVAPAQRGEQQRVAEVGVFRQDGTVAVGAEHIAPADALGAVAAVIAAAMHHGAERGDALAQIGAAAVVFKADDGPAAALRRAAKDEIADDALLRADGVEVHRAGIVELVAVPGAVIAAQHLVAAADGEDRLAVRRRLAQLARLAPGEVAQEHLLLEILSAAEEKEVEIRKARRFARGQRRDRAVDAAPRAALLKAENVAPVAVKVQRFGV